MLGVALDFKDYPDTTTPYTATTMNNMQKLLVDLIYPIGCYFETSDSDFNPNTAWGGTWEIDTSGTVLVSKSSTSGSKFNTDVGTVVGEEEHTLTVNEMPSHNHAKGYSTLTFYGTDGEGVIQQSNFCSYGDKPQNYYIPFNAGGNQPHNNVQPSLIVNRWHRTA